MRFGPVPLAEAGDAILAHSLNAGALRLKKGHRLGPADLEALSTAGIREVTVAQLGPGDVPEDAAASRIAAALAADPGALGVTISAAFTGRVNLHAAEGGVLVLDPERIDALNALDEAVTLATLPNHARVGPRAMLATVKIIPYAAPEAAVAAAEALLSRDRPVLRVAGLRRRSAGLLLTRTPGMAGKLIAKGAEAVKARLTALGIDLAGEAVVAHDTAAVAEALPQLPGEILLILTGSATSDRADTGPAGLQAAGGRLSRFGMPVDPGNLLFTGDLDGRPVIGLPGCARSPKLNGADWVLERVACGLDPDPAEIARMGVGGLLKEIPSRPEPRAGGAALASRPVIAAVLLAAGASRRMGGTDKLLEPVGAHPLLRHAAMALRGSALDEVVAVLRPGDSARVAALSGLAVRRVENPRFAEGMGTSIAVGLAAIRPDADAVLIAMADMPEIGSGDIDRLLAAFDPGEGRSILRAASEDGRPGHPVLFGRRFFEALSSLDGDSGAREVLRDHPDFTHDLRLSGEAALTDLDTPAAWTEWRRRSGTG